MANVTIYGALDDLIEIDGDITEEFAAYSNDDEPHYLAASNGVLLRIQYVDEGDDGIWRITPLAGADKVRIWQCPVDDYGHYSDIATIDDPLTWVTLANDHARPPKKD